MSGPCLAGPWSPVSLHNLLPLCSEPLRAPEMPFALIPLGGIVVVFVQL